jgi:hypothetical protein
MLAARTIGGLIALAAGLLALAGVRAAHGVDAQRLRSLLRSARFVGVFLFVWLVRDGAELALADAPPMSLARGLDVACVGFASLLAIALIFAEQIAPRPPLRVALAVLAALTALIGVARMFG